MPTRLNPPLTAQATSALSAVVPVQQPLVGPVPILEIAASPTFFLAGDWPEAAMYSAPWTFTIRPHFSSASTLGIWTIRDLFVFGDNTNNIRFQETHIRVSDGGVTVIDEVLVWDAEQEMTLTVDPAGTLTVAGATAGDGTYNAGAAFTWPAGVDLFVGQDQDFIFQFNGDIGSVYAA